MRRVGLARQIAFLLADLDMANAPTLGDIADRLGLRTGTAIGERLREARTYYGHDIRHFEVGDGRDKEHRYFMPLEERERVKKSGDYAEWKRRAKENAA
jgi:hypothetical protein